MRYDSVKRVAVLGAGVMGPGIAQSFAAAGYEVAIWSKDVELLLKSRELIQTSLATMVEANLLAVDNIPEILNRISFNETLQETIKDAEFIVEAIIENPTAKKSLYEELDRLCGEDVIIASNTSYLNIFDLMVEKRLPNTIITHWFAPAHIIPLVEVVKGVLTSEETIHTTVELLKRIDKTPVLLEKYVAGFIINRLQQILGKEIFYLLDNGYISPEQLDLAVKVSLAPRMMLLGLVQRYDFTGLDLSARNIENGTYIEPPNTRPIMLFEKVAKGDLGVKSGRGFYDYSGKTMEQVLHERDLALLKIFSLAKCLQE